MLINSDLLKQYIAENMIQEFSSPEECMKYLNTYGGMQLQSTEEMKEVQKEYGFGIGDKWYHVSFQEALDVWILSPPLLNRT